MNAELFVCVWVSWMVSGDVPHQGTIRELLPPFFPGFFLQCAAGSDATHAPQAFRKARLDAIPPLEAIESATFIYLEFRHGEIPRVDSSISRSLKPSILDII